MNNLKKIFKSLVPPKSENKRGRVFHSILIPKFQDFHLGMDESSRPVLIYDIKDIDSSKLPNIELENLRILHNVDCRVVPKSNKEIRGKFSIIQCLSNNNELIDYFLEIIEFILNSHSDDSDYQELVNAIDRLVELFQKIKNISTKSAQGLWTELFLIVYSKDPIIMLEAWHSDVNEIYDFQYGNHCVEVKSSSNAERKHEFSYNQAYPKQEHEVIIASFLLDLSSYGLSLGELWDTAKKMSSNYSVLRFKVEKICLEVLGKDWKIARNIAYDKNLAYKSIKFYELNDIPRVSSKHPKGVYDIRFKSDLSSTHSLNKKAYKSKSLLYKSCINLQK